MGQKGVNGMASFMNHGGDITHLSRRIHKDERRPRFSQWTIVASRRFSLAAFQVKAVHGLHGSKAIPEKWTHTVKTVHCLFQEFPARGKRAEGFPARRFGLHIPGPEAVQAQLFFLVLMDHLHQRKYVLLDCLMKPETVFLGIVKSPQFGKFVIPVIGKSRVSSYLLPLADEFGIKFIEPVLVLQPALLDLKEHFFPELPVGVFQELRRLLQGVFLAVYQYGHFT